MNKARNKVTTRELRSIFIILFGMYEFFRAYLYSRDRTLPIFIFFVFFPHATFFVIRFVRERRSCHRTSLLWRSGEPYEYVLEEDFSKVFFTFPDGGEGEISWEIVDRNQRKESGKFSATSRKDRCFCVKTKLSGKKRLRVVLSLKRSLLKILNISFFSKKPSISRLGPITSDKVRSVKVDFHAENPSKKFIWW